jgi:hypothetical protein
MLENFGFYSISLEGVRRITRKASASFEVSNNRRSVAVQRPQRNAEPTTLTTVRAVLKRTSEDEPNWYYSCIYFEFWKNSKAWA